MTRLKLDLAVVVSAEAFFTLTDLCGLEPDDAIASAAPHRDDSHPCRLRFISGTGPRLRPPPMTA